MSKDGIWSSSSVQTVSEQANTCIWFPWALPYFSFPQPHPVAFSPTQSSSFNHVVKTGTLSSWNLRKIFQESLLLPYLVGIVTITLRSAHSGLKDWCRNTQTSGWYKPCSLRSWAKPYNELINYYSFQITFLIWSILLWAKRDIRPINPLFIDKITDLLT